MKTLLFNRILPLTILSFAAVTKWWHTLPVDSPDTMYRGFPFPFVGEGWHTSMSLQIFVLELLVDFLIYFLFWFLVVVGVHYLVVKINPYKPLTIVLWVISGLVLLGATYLASFPEHIFYAKRPYDMKVLKTGYTFSWQQPVRPNDQPERIKNE